MFDRIVGIFVEVDDFCKDFLTQWEQYLISDNNQSPKRGPECSLTESEIMTIIIIYHRSNFKHFKNFYSEMIAGILKKYFPKLPSYNRFLELEATVIVPMVAFLQSKMGRKTGIYYIDSTPLPVCNILRSRRHKVFKGLAAKGKSSTGWFFGFKLHIVFNNLNEIMAIKLTSGNVHDTVPVLELTKNLFGKLFGDKGYLGKNLMQLLLKRGLHLMTRVRKNMKTIPMNSADKILLNARNMVETIIGNIKEFSGLNIPKHRSITNAFINICASVISHQLNPIKPKNLQMLKLN